MLEFNFMNSHFLLGVNEHVITLLFSPGILSSLGKGLYQQSFICELKQFNVDTVRTIC